MRVSRISPGLRLLIIALSYVLLPQAVYAQSETATVLGTVTDLRGAAVTGATVTLKDVQTNGVTTVQTNENGDYQFLNVKIGIYQVRAEAQNFASAVAEEVVVTVSARQRVDFSLKPGEISEVVVVTDAAKLLESDTSARGQVVYREQIINLPLNGRNYSDLALLAPGVTRSVQNQSGGVGSQTREGAFNVNGLRNTVNNYLLDGVDNNAYGTSNQSFSAQTVQVSPDAIAEFKIETNTYSAEYGRSGGAIINASYRSGTNVFHGSLWEFHRNTALNARGFFFNPRVGKPTLLRNQFGATLGGPIIKDRTFFFVDYEGLRQVQKQTSFSALPTLAQRQGILAVDVRAPYTYLAANGTTVQAGTLFPAGTPVPMTAFAQKVLNELPTPNVPGSSNFSTLVPNNNNTDKGNLRIDQRFTDKLAGFMRLSHRKSNIFEGPLIPGPSGSGQNGFVFIVNQQLAGGVTRVFDNGSVLDARLGISKIEAGKRPPLSGGPSMQALYGITGLPSDSAVTGGLTTQTIGGFAQLGRQATNPQSQDPFSVNPRVSYAFTAGRHSLKTGFEYINLGVDVNDTNPLMGLDTYTGQFSRPTGAASNNLYNLADFLVGARNQYELANFLVVNQRKQFYFTYLQDDFKLSNRLTFNLGLRYEFVTPFYERENRLSNYDPATNSIIQAKSGSLYERSLINPDWNNFAPRVGFAYNLFERTVLRGGYGVGYVYQNRLGSADLLATNYPQITRSTVTQGVTSPLCTGNNFSGCFRPTQQGYPPILPNGVVLYMPRNSRTPYVQNWHLSIQQQLTASTVLDVAYVGNHGLKFPLLADLNQAAVPTTIPASSLQSRRPIQVISTVNGPITAGTISAVLPAGFSNYNALQAKVEHRFNRGLYLLSAFTWSKAIDNAVQVLEEATGNTGKPQNLYNLAADRGISGYDQPFNSTTSAVWELPFGRGRAFGGGLPKVVDAVLGGWVLNANNTMTSGLPLTLRYTPSPVTANLPDFIGGVAMRPNVSGDPVNRGDRPDPTRNYFNVRNISTPPVTQPFGNAGRNIARSNAFFQLDLGVQKRFGLPFGGESTRLELRAEFFNVLNKTNFLPPDVNANNITRDANGNQVGGTFGTITGTYPARQGQVAIKMQF
jgi:hypothetical protein